MKTKTCFCLFFNDVKNGHFCSGPNSNADTLQKIADTFVFIGYRNLKDFLVNDHN